MTMRRRHWVALVLLLAALLRCYGLTRESLWNDELSTVRQIGLGVLSRQYWELIFSDYHPPGYLVFMSGYSAVFGDGELALRLPSALCGIALVAVVYSFARRLFGCEAGIVAAGLAAVSPLLVFYSQEGRSYAAVALTTLLGASGLARLLAAGVGFEKQAWRDRLHAHRRPVLSTALWFSLSSYLHYSGLLVAWTLGVFAWIYVSCCRRALLPLVAVASALFVGFYAPWLPGLLEHLARGGLPWLASPTLEQLRASFELALPSYAFALVLMFLVAARVFERTTDAASGQAGAADAQASTATRQSQVGTLLLLWWVLAFPIGMYVKSVFGESIFNARNLVVVVSPVLILLAGAVMHAPQRQWRHRFATALVALLLLDLTLGSKFYTTQKREDFRGATEVASRWLSRSPAPAIVCLAFSSEYFEYYFRRLGSPQSLACTGAQEDVVPLLERGTLASSEVVFLYGHLQPNDALTKQVRERYEFVQRVQLLGTGAWLLRQRH